MSLIFQYNAHYKRTCWQCVIECVTDVRKRTLNIFPELSHIAAKPTLGDQRSKIWTNPWPNLNIPGITSILRDIFGTFYASGQRVTDSLPCIDRLSDGVLYHQNRLSMSFSSIHFFRGESLEGLQRWWGEVRWDEVRWWEVRLGEMSWGEVRWRELRIESVLFD